MQQQGTCKSGHRLTRRCIGRGAGLLPLHSLILGRLGLLCLGLRLAEHPRVTPVLVVLITAVRLSIGELHIARPILQAHHTLMWDVRYACMDRYAVCLAADAVRGFHVKPATHPPCLQAAHDSCLTTSKVPHAPVAARASTALHRISCQSCPGGGRGLKQCSEQRPAPGQALPWAPPPRAPPRPARA